MMKKFIVLLLSLTIVFMFTACKSQQSEQAAEPATETTEEAAPEMNEVSGIVDSVGSGELIIYTKAKESLSFDIENATIEAENNIAKGDPVTVEYTGEIEQGETDDCEVSKVIGKTAKEETLEGKVKEVSKDGMYITIVNSDKEYPFNIADVKDQAAKAEAGATVAIKYVGILEDTNTRHAYVKGLTVTKAAEKKAEKDAEKNAVSSETKKEKVSSEEKSKTTENASQEGIKEEAKAQPEEKVAPEEETKPEEETTQEEETKPEEEATSEEETKPEEEAAAEEETKPEEEATAEEETKPEDEAKSEEAAPAEEAKTLTAKGVCKELTEDKKSKDKDQILEMENGDKYRITKKTKFDVDKDAIQEEYVGKKLKVEYKEGKDEDGIQEATHIYLVDAAKGPAESSSGTSPVAWIVGIIVVILVAGFFVARKRKE